MQGVHRGAGQELQTTQEMTRLNDDWQKLGKNLANASPSERDELHLALLRDIQQLISLVGDKSNLILDPDLDSYYLMDAILLKLPEGADLVGRLQIHLRRSLARSESLSNEDRIEDRKSTRLNSSHVSESRMPSSA